MGVGGIMKRFWKNVAVTVLTGGLLLGVSVGAQARDRREQRYDYHRNRGYRNDGYYNNGYYNGYYGGRNDHDRDDRRWDRDDYRYRRGDRDDRYRDRDDRYRHDRDDYRGHDRD
jgi:hypothetical protein